MKKDVPESHLDTDILLRAIASELTMNERVTTLVHLGGDCEVCHGRVREFAQGAESSNLSCAGFDPIGAALFRLVRSFQGDLRYPIFLSPIHWYWIDRCTESGWAFCRLVIEEMRRFVVEARSHNQETIDISEGYEKSEKPSRDDAKKMCSGMVDVVESKAFCLLGQDRWNDLRALAAVQQASVSFNADGDLLKSGT